MSTPSEPKPRVPPPELKEFFGRQDINPEWKGVPEKDCRWKIVKSGDDYFVALVPKYMLRDQPEYNDYEHAAGHIADCYVGELQNVKYEMGPLIQRQRAIEDRLIRHHTQE